VTRRRILPTCILFCSGDSKTRSTAKSCWGVDVR
jgi:hypothetical protein